MPAGAGRQEKLLAGGRWKLHPAPLHGRGRVRTVCWLQVRAVCWLQVRAQVEQRLRAGGPRAAGRARPGSDPPRLGFPLTFPGPEPPPRGRASNGGRTPGSGSGRRLREAAQPRRRRLSHVLQLSPRRAQEPEPGPAFAAQEGQYDARQEALLAGAGRERPERPLRPAPRSAGRAAAGRQRSRSGEGAAAAREERGGGGGRGKREAPGQPGPPRLHLQPAQAAAEPQQHPGPGVQLLGAADGLEVLRVPLHRVSSAPRARPTCVSRPGGPDSGFPLCGRPEPSLRERRPLPAAARPRSRSQRRPARCGAL